MPRAKLLVAVVVPLVVVGAVLLLWPTSNVPDLPSGVTRARYDAAARDFERRSGRKAQHLDVVDTIAEDEARSGDPELALACFAEIPTDHPTYGRAARYQEGQLLLRLKRAVEAEERFREFLDLEARSRTRPTAEIVDAIRRLRYLLEVQLRLEERANLLRDLVRADGGHQHDTMYYCFPDLLFYNGSTAFRALREFAANDPEDRHLKVAMGRFLVMRGELDDGRRQLAECLRRWPDDLHVIAAHLEHLDTIGDTDELDERIAALPPVAADDPWPLLRLRGEAHLRADAPEAAIDCFQRLLAGDPANNTARIGLAEAYRLLGRDEDRERVLAESANLARIQNLLGRGQTDVSDADTFLTVARLANEAGLPGRALYTARLAHRLDPQHTEASAFVEELESSALGEKQE